jgi:putative flippase GtrA
MTFKTREDVYQFAQFVMLSGASAVVTLVARYLLNALVVFEAAVMLSQVLGTIVAFTLNRAFVFGPGDHPMLQYARFVVVNCMSLLITTAVSALFYRVVLPALGVGFHPELCAHVIGLASSAVPSYLGHKYFSFRRSHRPGRVAL